MTDLPSGVILLVVVLSFVLLVFIVGNRLLDHAHVSLLQIQGRLSRRRRLIYDATGWFGMGALLFAYILLSAGYLSAHTNFYQYLIFFGSLTLGIEAYVKRAYPSVWVNVFFVVIALLALGGLFS